VSSTWTTFHAENLLREGLPPEMIARCIGLPLERVMQIAETIPAETIPAESIPKKAVPASLCGNER